MSNNYMPSWFAATFVVTSLICMLVGCSRSVGNRVVVGSKNFTEQAILGEMLATLIGEKTDLTVERKLYLGGTQVCHQALVNGNIDIYPEYTGTAYQVTLQLSGDNDAEEIYERVKSAYKQEFDVRWLDPFGFNNTYTLTMRKEHANELGITTISELEPHADKLQPGFDHEFLERPDGYRGLQKAYGFKFAKKPKQMDPGLMYRAIAKKQVDVIDAFATDGRIPAFDLVVLEDDRRFFPPYYAAPIVRRAVLENHPQLAAILNSLAGKIDQGTMRNLNYKVDEQGKKPRDVARQYLKDQGLI